MNPQDDKLARGGEPPLLAHEYDGIREYDNPLPGWWSGIFIACILFAPVYWFWFHGGGPGQSETARFDQEWRVYAGQKAEYEKTVKLDVTEELLTTMARDAQVLDAGSKIFTQSCVGCHLADGSGQTGPNLTDEYQIHGDSRLHLFETIRDGVPAKGMITWSAMMEPRDLATVAAFVSTLRGMNLPGKVAEGAHVGSY